jgi:hypothetical protein
MANPVDLAMLQKMTPKQRMVIYEHARNGEGADADNIIKILFENNLLDTAGGGLPREHRVIQEIEAVCRSKDGVRAAISAATRGEAPLAGVDPMIQLSVREYGHFDTTTWAGHFVADEVEGLGWRRKGQRRLPANCVAKTAAFFLPPETK